MKYLLVIENAGGNLSAFFPDVPGCVAVGSTVEEVRQNASEALSLHFEDEVELPEARTLREAMCDLDLDGSEVIAWVSYEPEAVMA